MATQLIVPDTGSVVAIEPTIERTALIDLTGELRLTPRTVMTEYLTMLKRHLSGSELNMREQVQLQRFVGVDNAADVNYGSRTLTYVFVRHCIYEAASRRQQRRFELGLSR